MNGYCDPISWADWHGPESDSLWRETPEDAKYRERRARLELDDALNAQSVTALKRQQLVIEHLLEERFQEHADKWERETVHLSSPTQMMRHPDYEAILLMGLAVVPLLIKDLRKNRRYWFGALTYITGENPITRSDAGRMDRMIEAWVKWGQKKGLI
jgi:hypothetical protein